jgi:hypothetical protein
LPGGEAFGDQHGETEGEGAGPVVQDGMTQVFVAGVQPGGGAVLNTVLPGIAHGAWSGRFSSREAR